MFELHPRLTTDASSMETNANLHALPAPHGYHGQRLIAPTPPTAGRFDVHDAAVHDPHDRADHDAFHPHFAGDDSRSVAFPGASRGIVLRDHRDDFGYFFDDVEHCDT